MAQRYRIREVLNYGGFFAGDTVTLIAAPLSGGEERDFTIDEHAFTNVTDRHKVVAGMLVELETAGEKVEKATVVGAGEREALRAALESSDELADPNHPEYRVFAYRCPECAAWIYGEPAAVEEGGYACRLCHTPFPEG